MLITLGANWEHMIVYVCGGAGARLRRRLNAAEAASVAPPRMAVGRLLCRPQVSSTGRARVGLSGLPAVLQDVGDALLHGRGDVAVDATDAG